MMPMIADPVAARVIRKIAEVDKAKAELDAVKQKYEAEFGEIMPIVENQMVEPKPRKTIFQLSAEALALDALLDEHLTQSEGEMTPEIEAVITAWLEETAADLDTKLDAYAAVITERQAKADLRAAAAKPYQDEAARYAKLIKSDLRQIDGMKARLKWFFETHNIERRETDHHKFSLVGNGGKAPIVIDEESLPESVPRHFVKELDKTVILAALESGEELDFARIGERGRSLRIK